MKKSFQEFAKFTISSANQKKIKGGQTCITSYYSEDGWGFDESGECGTNDCIGDGGSKYADMGLSGITTCV